MRCKTYRLVALGGLVVIVVAAGPKVRAQKTGCSGEYVV
jgi:hypothetical protein